MTVDSTGHKGETQVYIVMIVVSLYVPEFK